MSKFRLTVYLSASVADRLAIACKRPGANRSKLVDRALDQFLGGHGGQANEAQLFRRLDMMTKQATRSDRNIAVILETLGLFVRYYLTITPPLPKSEQDPARALGNQRFEFFIAQIGKRLATGQSVVREVMERVAANDPDLFLHGLDEPAIDGSAQHQKPSTNSSPEPAGPGRGGEAPVPQRRSSASSPPDAVPGASSQGGLSQDGGGARG
jgi:hypothetical protein